MRDIGDDYAPTLKGTYTTPSGRTFGIKKLDPRSAMFVVTATGKGDIPKRLKGQWTSVSRAEKAIATYVEYAHKLADKFAGRELTAKETVDHAEDMSFVEAPVVENQEPRDPVTVFEEAQRAAEAAAAQTGETAVKLDEVLGDAAAS